MGVVRMYRCGYIIITFSYSTCISSCFGSSIPISLFILKMFFRSFIITSGILSINGASLKEHWAAQHCFAGSNSRIVVQPI